MTVRRLISALKKMPPDAFVGWQNHDQNIEEIDGFVNSIEMAEPYFYDADARRAEWLGKRRVVILGS